MPPDPTESLVAELYQGVLGRQPDGEGLQHYRDVLKRGTSVSEVLGTLLGSDEFQARHPRPPPLMPSDYAEKLDVELAPSAAAMERLWAHVGATWAELGRSDPFWSVLSAPGFRLPAMTEAKEEAFYRSGEKDLHRIEAWLGRAGLALRPEMGCAELGCGLGRLSAWLAPRCRHLRAFDISAPHLARAETRLRGQGIANVSFICLSGQAGLRLLDGVDLFVSFLVLQHNPPPVMAAMLDQAFLSLAPGGLALFQVPTYRAGYRFMLDDYLSSIGGAGGIEMHCLPQGSIFALAARHGVTPLEVQQDALAGEAFVSHTFLFRKSG